MWWYGDVWWLSTLYLFGPRWVVLLPLAVLIPSAIWRRGPFAPLLVATVIILGPVLGFRTGWRTWLGGADQPDDIRVVTFNTAGGWNVGSQEVATLLTLRPDVIAIQECSLEDVDLMREATDWFVHSSGGSLCLVSRYPIDGVAQQEREPVQYAGGSGWVIRYAIRTPIALIQLTNVHLDTPRSGFEQVRAGRVALGAQDLASKSVLREIESRRARRWVDEGDGPFLVTGDFNMPVESVIYRRYWGDLTNAFSRGGIGFGATRLNGWIRVRIDHILVGPGWRVRRAFVGPDLGSDHKPMIADLRWSEPDGR